MSHSCFDWTNWKMSSEEYEVRGILDINAREVTDKDTLESILEISKVLSSSSA